MPVSLIKKHVGCLTNLLVASYGPAVAHGGGRGGWCIESAKSHNGQLHDAAVVYTNRRDLPAAHRGNI